VGVWVAEKEEAEEAETETLGVVEREGETVLVTEPEKQAEGEAEAQGVAEGEGQVEGEGE